MPRLTITEIAAEVGVHKSTVSRQVRRLSLLGEDGRVDLDEYRAAREGLDPALQTTGTPRRPESSAGALAEARLDKMRAEAEQAKLDLRKRNGELIERSLLAEVWGPRVRKLRDALVALPRDVIADPGEAARCEEAIAAELDRFAMEILNDGGAPAAG